MTIETILVHVDIDAQNDALFELTRDLATRLDARVIGICACQPLQVRYFGEPNLMAQLFEEDRTEIENQVRLAEERFLAGFHDHVREIGWRSTITFGSIAAYIAREARAADLIIIDPNNFSERIDPLRRLSVEDFIMRVGRPILLTAPRQPKLHLDHVVVGWKDSAESQRAISAALPLLRHAGLVTVAEVAQGADLDQARERVQDVTLYLKHHGIKAEPHAAWLDSDATLGLEVLAKDIKAGLVIGGAFGHSRLREWVFGGVTRDLLLHPVNYSTLVSH